ncbi:uncharacterized protein LOC126902951 isoform X2 [Daktulosphaira vitifoliae]|uniref:uncharacterized protein LOC126902951 isoform X2 n=1 Tax=Daktulosphaira vitifoliae TaxID=58002 RepID=UPI0021AAC4F3|nr:uncharacterized protein LOC126902951 isoform X2 [Daktulosphaira vitifoliae]
MIQVVILLLFSTCQVTLQNSSKLKLSQAVMSNPGWKSLQKIKIIKNGKSLSYDDIENLNDINLMDKNVSSMIMCKYAHNLLDIATYIEYMATQFKALEVRGEKLVYIKYLYAYIIDIEKQTDYMLRVICYMISMKIVDNSFLIGLLKTLWINTNEEIIKPYIDALVSTIECEKPVDSAVNDLVRPFKELKEKINDDIMGEKNFCVKGKPSIPSWNDLNNSYLKETQMDKYWGSFLDYINLRYKFWISDSEFESFNQLGFVRFGPSIVLRII